MAIVKMKRLRLMGLRSDREELLRLLQSMGCVELREPDIDLTDPDWAALAKPDGSGLSRAREQNQLLTGALTSLDKYAPAKKGLFAVRPAVSEAELFDDGAYSSGLETARQIAGEEKALAACQAEQSKLKTQRASLEPWSSLDVPLDQEGTANVSVIFGAAPAKADFTALEGAVAGTTELAQLYPAGRDRELQYFLLVCHNSTEHDCAEALRPSGFSRVNLRGWTGTAEDNIRAIDNRLAALEREEREHRERVASFADRRESLRRCADRSVQEIGREESKARLVDTQAAFYLDGWLPADQLPRVEEALAPYPCAYETADPTQDEYPEVPVKLKNNIFDRCMNVITEMYSLPAYDGIDPNPLMAPFFIFFFGFMMADMGYGILMIAASLVVLLKMKPREGTRNFMELVFWCGISTFLIGALTGGFFGDFIPQLLTLINPDSTFKMPALFTPLDDTVAIMVGSIAMGVIQIFTGMTVSAVRKIKDGNFIDALFSEFTWWIILAGVALLAVSAMGIAPFPAAVGAAVTIAGFLMLAVGGTRKARGFGKVTSFIGLVYNGVTGYFSDSLSYIRLMALMLSGSVIASVFNTLGATVGTVPVIGIVLFIVISMVGNALNMALNLLGCYVHDLRLQCLEFFNRFYKEGGKPYRPLAIQTKYTDIIKEEN